MLIGTILSQPSQALNVPYTSQTVTFNYTGGTVTFTSCSDQACTWAIDDAAQLVVTRPDGTQVTRDLSSDTKDKQALDVTNLFQVGANTVTTNLIDHQGPLRGLPRPLYLVESTGALPTPRPPVKSLPVSMRYNNNPYATNSKDPVNTFTGSYLYTHTDVDIEGRGPAPHFNRSYDSSNTLSGPLGPGWTHSYAMQLVRPDDTTNDIVLIGPQGRADRFTYTAGTYTAPIGIYMTLVKNSDGTYTVTQQDQTTWSFDETGKLLRVADRLGNKSTLSYNASNQLIGISDPAGRGSLILAYDGVGRLISVTDWANRVVRYGYDSNGRLSTVTDREGQSTTYGYDASSQRIVTIKDARNDTAVTNTYETQGRVATQKDGRGLATGQQTTFAYTTNADGTKTTVITYPKTSADTTWSLVEEDTYDTQGRIIKKVSKPTVNTADWVTEEYSYDGNGNRGSYKDGRGNTTQYCYDVSFGGTPIAGSRGNLTRMIAPPPTAGANLVVTLYGYDSKNNLVTMVAPKGVFSTATTTCTSNLMQPLNPNYSTSYTYDSATQTKLLATTSYYNEPGAGLKTVTTKVEYGDTANPGFPTKVVSPRGNTGSTPDYAYATTNTYFTSGGKAGMLASVTTPTGAVTQYDYDAVGRRTSMIDPKGTAAGGVPADHTWQYLYDNEDRVRFTKAPGPATGQAALVSENRYDAVGNKTAAIDANGQVTKYVYDERDKLQTVQQSPNAWSDPSTTPAGLISTEYQYDNLGNLTRIIRAKGDSSKERATDYTFDGFNRVVKETQYPNWPITTPTLVTAYTYDKNDNKASQKDPLSKTTTYAYDALNRLTNITYNSPATPNVTYGYDANGNRTNMVDGTGTTTYTYDELDRTLSAQSPGPKTVGYRYDLDSNRTKLIYPDNTAVSYTFDAADRMQSVVDWSNRTTSYDYYADSTVKKINNQMNGTSANYTYDNADRLTQVWNMEGTNTITQHTYRLDAAGNRTHADEVLMDGDWYGSPITSDRQSTVDYSYDKLYRMTREVRNMQFPQDDETLDYTYDAVGNRSSETITAYGIADRTDYTYDKVDRPLASTGNVSETFVADANGNITSRGDPFAYSLAYDQANRMIQSNSSQYRYAYDGDGNRTKIQQTGAFGSLVTKNTYVYDTNRDLPVLLQDINNKYVWGLELLYTVDSSNNPGVYHFDGNGSMVAISDVRGTDQPRIQMYEAYRAYGVEGYSNRTYKQPFNFTGEQKDGDLDNAQYVYLRSRYYDPVIGRFTTRDSYTGDIMRPQSLNRYSYVQNNPVNFTDPSGLVNPGQVFSGSVRVLGGASEALFGAGVSMETLGMGAVLGVPIMIHGGWEFSAGTAEVINGFQDKETNIPTMPGAIVSSFTTDENYVALANVADFLFFARLSSLKNVGSVYKWLKYVGAVNGLTEGGESLKSLFDIVSRFRLGTAYAPSGKASGGKNAVLR